MLAATKVNGVVGSAVLGCALLGPLAARARRGEARAAGADALRFGVPVLALWLPWLAKSAAYTGNPVYPLAFGWLGGPDWSPRLGEQLVAWQRSIGMGRGLADFLWLPLRVTLEAGPGYDRFGGVIGAHWLAAPVLAAAGWRHPLVRAGLLVSGVGFAAWALGSQQARFLIPLLPVLALCAALGALEGLARVGGASARRVGAALLAVAALGLAVQTMRRPAAEARALWPRLSAGAEALRADAVQPLHHFVATLPADAHLLLLDTNQVFFLERASWSDSFFEASQIADALRGAESAEQAHALLRERGITHVLRARIEWGIDWPAGLVALLEDPRLSRRRFLASDGRHEVFELLPRDPA
jgi:hypothetical protein